MTQAYIVGKNSQAKPMKRIRCSNEDQELQLLLEKTPQLIPGDQICPDDPRRWLLIRREMPVPDPATGANRWSVDHLFVDQEGIPTFVECKRFLDTRSKREVVGQMLDYAANGPYYWEKSLLRDYAEKTACDFKLKLEELIRELQPATETVDGFFEMIEKNLLEGKVRLIFFMEEAPQELKSIVDFLNKQMERTEMLIVEAKQFEEQGIKVVFPQLFGYSEEARRAKRNAPGASAERKRWDEKSYFIVVEEKHSPDKVEAIRKLYNFALNNGLQINWGTGKVDGSFSIALPGDMRRNLINVYSSGWLVFPYGSILGSVEMDNVRSGLADIAVRVLKQKLPEDFERKYPNIRLEDWAQHADELLDFLRQILIK